MRYVTFVRILCKIRFMEYCSNGPLLLTAEVRILVFMRRIAVCITFLCDCLEDFHFRISKNQNLTPPKLSRIRRLGLNSDKYKTVLCNMAQFCTIRIAPQPSSSDVVCLISKMAAVGGGGGGEINLKASRAEPPVHLAGSSHCLTLLLLESPYNSGP